MTEPESEPGRSSTSPGDPIPHASPESGHGEGTDGAPEKRVSWAELFFDLVFVFAVTQVSNLLQADHSPLGVANALVVFVPTYWTWVGTTMHANLHEVEQAKPRVGLFAVGLCGLLIALAIPDAFGPSGVLFGASYWAARVVLLLLVRDAYRGVRFNPFTAAAVVTGPLLLLGGLAPVPARLVLWAIAGSIDLTVPYLVRHRLAAIRFEPSHLAERYGLFIIIALGESVVAIGAAVGRQAPTGAQLVAVALAFVLVCALWWAYFVFASGAIRHALRTAAVPMEVILPVLPYGHLGFLAGIIASAAGIGHVIDHPLDALPVATAALLNGGVALYLVVFGYTRWQMFHTLATPRLLTGGVCLLLLPGAGLLPALGTVALLALALVALNVAEARIVPRDLRSLSNLE